MYPREQVGDQVISSEDGLAENEMTGLHPDILKLDPVGEEFQYVVMAALKIVLVHNGIDDCLPYRLKRILIYLLPLRFPGEPVCHLGVETDKIHDAVHDLEQTSGQFFSVDDINSVFILEKHDGKDRP